MKQDNPVEYFKSRTPSQILAEKAGKWSDSVLLDVLQYFSEEGQQDQETAVMELILLSPENGDMVWYPELYTNLAEYYHWKEDFPAALRWSLAALAYDEQHYPGLNRDNNYRDLAESYLYAGDFDTGLAILTRRLQIAPGDIWTHNILGMALPDVGLDDLAVEVLDRALALTAQEDPENIREQLEELHQEALDNVNDNDFESYLDEIDPDVLSEFRAALQLPVPEDQDEDAPEPYLPPLDRLLDLGSEQDKSLYDEILAQDKVLAPDLIRMAFDENLWDTAVPTHAVALLRELRTRTPELDSLAPWLERADGNWPAELLTKWMGKIGGHTTPELETIAADTGCHLYVRTFATNALVERAEKCPDQRDRIIGLFRVLLTRPEAFEAAEETFIGFLVSDITDLEAKELYDEIKRAYDEDRVDSTIIDLPYVHQKWDLKPLPQPEWRSDGLNLLLHCTNCHRERYHFVQHVLVDLNTLEKQTRGLPVKYDAHIMDREIICPKCQAVDQYELTPQANLRLYMPNADVDDITAMLTGGKPKQQEPNPFMTSFKAYAFGRPMHPLVALEEYRQKIAARPNDALLHMRLGNMLRTLRREAQSLAAFRQAYELAPEHAEICLTRGMAEHDYGDRDVAKTMYEEVLRLISPVQMLRQDEQAGMAFAAAEGLKNLKRGKTSPHQSPVHDAEDVAPPPQRGMFKRKRSKKKGKRRR